MNFENRILTTKEQYLVLKKWHEFWGGYPICPFESLPRITVLTYNSGRLICSCGCYLSEGKLCLIDNLVSDPASDQQTRDKALDECVAFAMKLAKEQGYKYWNAHSRFDAIEKRSRKFNRTYCEPGHYFMTGEL